MNRGPLERFLLVLLTVAPFSVTCAQERPQAPTLHPELIAGPWETSSPSGIDGIFFNIETSSDGPVGRQEIAWQTIQIRVYHRKDAKKVAGWFATNEKATPESYNLRDDHSFTLFNGERLRIHFTDVTELRPFDLDVIFSPTTREWTGTWYRDGQSLPVLLQRPNPSAGIIRSDLVADWESEQDSTARYQNAAGSLHIRESSDGMLSAWLDRTMSGMDPRTQSVLKDQRNGELLDVTFANEDTLALETTFTAGLTYRYQASLSKDRQVLTGVWEDAGGSRLNAPAQFHRAAKIQLPPAEVSGTQGKYEN
jgi:hypothetical protein